MMKIFQYVVITALLLALSGTTIADGDVQFKADVAVANILFDYDFGSEFASYRVDRKGFVDIIMAKNTPDEVYAEILTRLQNHPDIDGVLSSKSGPACKVSNW